jgi:hypothetical protein
MMEQAKAAFELASKKLAVEGGRIEELIATREVAYR